MLAAPESRLSVCLALLSVFSAASVVRGQPGEDVGDWFDVPDGFVVEQFAGDDLAHDIYTMTVAPDGQVVVSGPNYIRVLVDGDEDGVAESSQLFAEAPRTGGHGLCFYGGKLYCNGDHHLLAFDDADGDLRADGPPRQFAELRNGEHGGNGIVVGPDGWLYVACGNDAGVTSDYVTTDASPIRDPRCGVVLRVSPDGEQQEIIADGFRNIYDLTFGPTGRLFVVDSDGERDFHLPWYGPMRLFDVRSGREHGWLLSGWQRSWNRPPYFFDSGPRLDAINRGSPTGIVCYRHTSFPERYRGGLFHLDWTLGRLYFHRLTPEGAGFSAERDTFLQVRGSRGFAPVDVAVAPNGDLFIAIGGRGTQGGVFRVHYDGAEEDSSPADATDLQVALSTIQPDAAWSRATWRPAAERAGRDAVAAAIHDATLPPANRARAVEVLVEVFDGVADDDLAQVRFDAPTVVGERLTWAIRFQAASDTTRAWVRLVTENGDPAVLRTAWETIAVQPGWSEAEAASLPWAASLLSSDRYVRDAAFAAASRFPEAARTSLAEVDLLPARLAEFRLECDRITYEESSALAASGELLTTIADALADENTPLDWQLTALRLLELAVGDVRNTGDDAEVYSGYRARSPGTVSLAEHPQLAAALVSAFDRGNPAVQAEVARVWAMLLADAGEDFDSRAIVERLAAAMTPESGVPHDLHFLIAASSVPGTRSEAATRAIAAGLLQLHDKLDAQGRQPSRNWPTRVGEAVAGLFQNDPHLADAIAHSELFCRPEQASFVLQAPPTDGARLASALVDRLEAEVAWEDWTPDAARAAMRLPRDRALFVLRQLFDVGVARGMATQELAANGSEKDRDRLLEALSQLDRDAVVAAAKALARLPAPEDPTQLARPLALLLRESAQGGDKELVAAAVKLLAAWSPLIGGEDDTETVRQTLVAEHPELEKLAAGAPAADWPAWQARLAGIEWSQGSEERGEAAFRRLQCAACHGRGSQLGPDLAGVAQRLSNEDLFAEIVDPSRSVAPTYRTTLVVTDGGRAFHGVVVYESPEGTLLRTGPDETTRIAGDAIVEMTESERSLMPVGLLNESTDQELADLRAYLASLTPPDES